MGAEERDRKRYLSHKFALTGAGEYKWIGSTFGNKTAMLHTVRATLLRLHSQILATFMHPNWTLMRKPWIAAVNACVSPRDLGRARSVLAACIRPVVFTAVWHDSLGHIRLQRQTAFDREEKKKVDRRRSWRKRCTGCTPYTTPRVSNIKSGSTKEKNFVFTASGDGDGSQPRVL